MSLTKMPVLLLATLACLWSGLFQEALALRVVTSVAPLTDMVQQVGGGLLQVKGLVPEGVNSHTFQPAPGDLHYLSSADLVILNGLELEVPLEKLARSSGKKGLTIVKLGDSTISKTDWVFDFSFPKAQGHPNPHLWLNVEYARRYVVLIRDHLQAMDAAHAAAYRHNAERYLAHLALLDRCISAVFGTVPLPQRKLLTYHDSWPYFAQRYGLTVIGAVQPANFAEPSAREVARLIDQLRRTKVPAVFGSEVFPSKVLEKIASEAGVRYVTSLRDDALPGAVGAEEHTYSGMMQQNVMTMAEALGGQPATFTSCFSEPATR